jgi:hypothetical protein
MKTYLVVTGSLFALLALAHLWRVIGEWPRLMHDSGEMIEAAIGVLAATLSVWAWRLLRAHLTQTTDGAAA